MKVLYENKEDLSRLIDMAMSADTSMQVVPDKTCNDAMTITLNDEPFVSVYLEDMVDDESSLYGAAYMGNVEEMGKNAIEAAQLVIQDVAKDNGIELDGFCFYRDASLAREASNVIDNKFVTPIYPEVGFSVKDAYEDNAEQAKGYLTINDATISVDYDDGVVTPNFEELLEGDNDYRSLYNITVQDFEDFLQSYAESEMKIALGRDEERVSVSLGKSYGSDQLVTVSKGELTLKLEVDKDFGDMTTTNTYIDQKEMGYLVSNKDEIDEVVFASIKNIEKEHENTHDEH